MSRRILSHEPYKPFDKGEKRYDVAVIGGGVSGVYTAWRLKQSNRKLKVALFEYGNRIGGRLYSYPMPGMPNIKAELGGMRWLLSHEIVVGLIRHLKLRTRVFPMGKDGGANNLMYLRRRQLRVKDLTDPAKVPYLMNPDEQGMNPDQLQAYVMDSLLPFNKDLSATDWWTVPVLNGTPLYKLGFWNLLYKVLSSEAYQYMYDASGYYTNVANSTAPLSLPITEYDPNNQYYTLDDGYEELPRTIAQRFRDLGGEIHMNHRLDSFGRRGADGDYAMCFVKTETDEGGKTHDLPGRPEAHLDAEKVVLALPRRSIELIRWNRMDDGSELRDRVESVISQAAFKMFLGYPYPWWRALGVDAGRTITDMPIRQTYYFQTESEMGGDPENHNSLLMVSYNDLGSVPFWKALEWRPGVPRFEGRTDDPDCADADAPRRNYHLNGEPAVRPHEFTMSKEMVSEAQDQVREVHGLKFVPEPYTAVYHDWGDDPYGAGWHAWKAGVEFWDVMPYMRGIPGEKVHVCGEAYSIGQGWVEGALQTAELMLKEHFGLKRPEFIPKEYYDKEMGP
ncbi:MAG TPA: FAD-dependent oxidoreductase [Longimicrobiaceae bacterium]|nr:FAD-dependent oxidoreductase [Longimicrobiaceae bacterium]